MIRKFRLHPTQAAFLNSTARFRAYIGGIRSGKTWVGCHAMLIELMTRGGLGMIVAPTFPMLRDSTLRTFKEMAGELIRDFNIGEMRATLVNGAEILFRSADDPNRLRGATLRAFWIDEASQTTQETWLIGQGRLSVAGARAWITTTPTRGKFLKKARKARQAEESKA